jgi:DNA-binding MarR family transcriptional regulator
MKLLDSESNSSEECAAIVADVIPLVMRDIRAEMRRHREADLTVPQFRSLGFVRRNPGASLSAVAEHVGLTLPSTSKMIDRLEAQGLLTRVSTPEDRRRIALKLTDEGTRILQNANAATRSHLADQLSVLSPEARATIMEAMAALRTVFAKDHKKEREDEV